MAIAAPATIACASAVRHIAPQRSGLPAPTAWAVITTVPISSPMPTSNNGICGAMATEYQARSSADAWPLIAVSMVVIVNTPSLASMTGTARRMVSRRCARSVCGRLKGGSPLEKDSKLGLR